MTGRVSRSMKQAGQENVLITIHVLSVLYITLSVWHRENMWKDHEVLCPEELRNMLLLGCHFSFLWPFFFFKFELNHQLSFFFFFFPPNHSKGFSLNVSPLTWEFEFLNLTVIMVSLGVIKINVMFPILEKLMTYWVWHTKRWC